MIWNDTILSFILHFPSHLESTLEETISTTIHEEQGAEGIDVVLNSLSLEAPMFISYLDEMLIFLGGGKLQNHMKPYETMVIFKQTGDMIALTSV